MNINTVEMLPVRIACEEAVKGLVKAITSNNGMNAIADTEYAKQLLINTYHSNPEIDTRPLWDLLPTRFNDLGVVMRCTANLLLTVGYDIPDPEYGIIFDAALKYRDMCVPSTDWDEKLGAAVLTAYYQAIIEQMVYLKGR